MSLASRIDIDRTKLIIDREVAVVAEGRERLGTVVLEVAAFVINLLQEQMVRVGRAAEEIFERPIRPQRRRIAVCVKIG